MTAALSNACALPAHACTCGHPWHDGPCEHTRSGQPDDGWTPMCDCRHPEPEHDQ